MQAAIDGNFSEADLANVRSTPVVGPGPTPVEARPADRIASSKAEHDEWVAAREAKAEVGAET